MSDDAALKSLEPTAQAFQAAVEKISARLSEYLDSLSTLRTPDLSDAPEWTRSLRLGMPQQGVSLESLLDLLFGAEGKQDGLVYRAFNTTGGGYLAYVPGGGLVTAALADLIADVTNRYVGLWLPAPGLVAIETEVVRWLCEVVGYPSTALGFLTTGGSQSNHSAVIVARSEKLGDRVESGVAYISDQVHHSVKKAFFLAGIPRANVRVLPTDSRFHMDLDALRKTIRRDRELGLTPFLVVGSGGTTNTGSVDDLERISGIARAEGLWFHVDAAYGGFFILTERGRRALRGMALADSITLDPHKGLFLPYGTGSLLVRERGALHRTFSSNADYLPSIQDDWERVDFCEISGELSRDFRGLRVWLPVQLAGVDAFRNRLDEKLDLTGWAARELGTVPGLKLLAEPELSTIAFRLVVDGLPAEDLNRMNRELLAKVNRKGRIFISGTMIGEYFVLRFCIVSFRTHLEHLQEAVNHVRASVAELL